MQAGINTGPQLLTAHKYLCPKKIEKYFMNFIRVRTIQSKANSPILYSTISRKLCMRGFKVMFQQDERVCNTSPATANFFVKTIANVGAFHNVKCCAVCTVPAS